MSARVSRLGNWGWIVLLAAVHAWQVAFQLNLRVLDITAWVKTTNKIGLVPKWSSDPLGTKTSVSRRGICRARQITKRYTKTIKPVSTVKYSKDSIKTGLLGIGFQLWFSKQVVKCYTFKTWRIKESVQCWVITKKSRTEEKPIG